MSTKTTLKRIALVAVSALGFGMLSVAPSSAATGSMSLSTTSLTVVGGTESASGSGLFYVDTFNTDGDAAALSSESIQVTVTGKPTYRKNGVTAAQFDDVTIQPVTTTDGTAFSTCGAAVAETTQVPNGGGACASSDWTYVSSTVDSTTSRYWFAVYPSTTGVADAGEYTLTIRLRDSAAFVVQTKTLKVKFVADSANSGAAIAISQTGTARSGSAYTYTSTSNTKVTLTDANGGRVVVGATVASALVDRAPQLSAALLSSAGAVVSEGDLTIPDTGVAATDYVAPTNGATKYAYGQAGNGIYGIAVTSLDATASTVSSIRVRYGATSTSAAWTILGATTADETKVDLTLTAAGLAIGEELVKSDVDTTTTYYLPLTTTSGSLKINVDNSGNTALANLQMRVKRTWSGNYVSADVTPTSQTAATTETTDASGNITIPFTNAAPVDGGTLTFTVTGFDASLTGYVNGTRTIVINWQKAAVESIAILDPVSGVRVKAGSTNVFTVMVKDQFGNGMSGEKVQPAITGTDDNNYSATTTLATITTGATGTATFSLTDAAAVAGTDTVKFTTITGGKTASMTLTYVTTLPVVATLRAFFNRDATTASDATSTWTLVPSTGIYTTDGGSTKLSVTAARNYSRSLSGLGAATDDDLIKYRVEALTSAGASATGAAVTVTAGTGGYLVGADNLKTTSRTYPVSGGYIYFVGGATGTGAVTFTITAGTVSASASQWMANATADARYVAMAASASTGTANGASVPVTVTVTDRFGNPVSGTTLTLTATGVGSFSGGATTQSFTTDSTGKYTFLATSTDEAGGAGTFTATATNATEAASSAGYVLATAVDSTLTAGVKSASATITFAAGRNAATVAAEAASDAAAEAIDAANAATDAANLAAEAADAATVAAEEARDAADAATAAVEELATQVATLMAALKAQITTLANTVAKIAKKVKA